MTPQPSQSAFSSPQAELFLRLLRVSDQLNRAFQLRLRPFQLTHPQYNVLRILRGAPASGLTCSSIGHSMITAEPDITRLLARLRLRKLVAQRRDPADRRVVWTRITSRGLALLKELDPIVELEPQQILRALTADQVHQLNALLQLLGSGSQPDHPPLCPGSASASSPLAAASLAKSCPAASLAHPDAAPNSGVLRRSGPRVTVPRAPR